MQNMSSKWEDNLRRISRVLFVLFCIQYLFRSSGAAPLPLQRCSILSWRLFTPWQLLLAGSIIVYCWYNLSTIFGTQPPDPTAKHVIGRAGLKFYHSHHTLSMSMKNQTTTSFSDLCKSVIEPCHLNPWLFNGHLQTLWTVFHKKDIEIYYKRMVLTLPDPNYTGSFAVDIVTGRHAANDASLPPRTIYYTDSEVAQLKSLDSKPMLIVLHGLRGGSHELYLRQVIAPLISKTGGWEACVINSRGCAKSIVTSSMLYNAGSTWDTRRCVEWLSETFPNRRLFAIGFSLGGNILTNYIGEEGSRCPLKAAAVISNPWNLEVCSLSLQRSVAGLHIYSRAMGRCMRDLTESNIEHLSRNSHINVDEIRNMIYLHEFDRSVQRQTWGYPTEGAYYRDASSVDSVFAVRVPLLALHAEDDPIATYEALPIGEVQQTPYVFLCTTSGGGHLGWFDNGGGRWYARTVASFFQKLAQEVNFEKTPDPDQEFKGYIDGDQSKPMGPVFEPTRTKLYIPDPVAGEDREAEGTVAKEVEVEKKSYAKRPRGEAIRQFSRDRIS